MRALPADRACGALVRALRPVAGPFAVVASRSQDWSSATFDGARHRLALRLEGDAPDLRARALADTLPALDVPMDGGFVASIAVAVVAEGDGVVLGIEALTIEEAPLVPLSLPRAGVSGGARRCG